MDDMEIKGRIVSFIKKKLGLDIDDDTILFRDLELIGIDADIFMDNFHQEFNVDFSNLKFEDYFLEVSAIPFYYWYLKAFKKEKLKRKEFKLDHLVKVVKAGKWIEP